jgi:hypothetical protein
MVGSSREGFGVQIWKDGAHYVGLWKEHKASGLGRFRHADGDVYLGNLLIKQGEFIRDKASGYGYYVHSNGSKYDGEWYEDHQEGLGNIVITSKVLKPGMMHHCMKEHT